MSEPQNLMEGLLHEMNRVRELIVEYKSIPSGAGMLGAKFMEFDIKKAERAIASGDVIDMLVQYNNLKSCE